MRWHVRDLPRHGWLLVSALVSAALIAGCSTRSPGEGATHYLLTEQPTASEETITGGERLLRVKRVELARYLDVEGIVMQTSDVAVRSARNHLWAEDLATQLQRDLVQRLSEQLEDVRVLDPDQQLRAPEREIMQLTVTVDRFQGRFDGYAVVGGKWRLLDSEGEIRDGERFLREQVLTRDGYPALVESLKDAWTRVVAGIANGIQGTWAGNGPAD